MEKPDLIAKGEVASPVFSPDGQYVAFAQHDGEDFELFILDRKTGNVSQITNDKRDDLMPAWSPEGGRIAWQKVDQASIDTANSSEIWIGSPENNAGGQPLTHNEIMDVYPVWSDNGHWIVYEAGDKDNLFGLWKVMAPDQSSLEQIRENNLETNISVEHVIYEPEHSANGIPHVANGQIVYERSDDGISYYVAAIPLNGSGNVERLSSWEVRANPTPRFHPDGMRIAAHGNTDGSSHMEIHISDTDGNFLQKFRGAESLRLPRWSRGGHLVAAEGGGTHTLYLLDTEQKNIVPLKECGPVNGQKFMRIWSYDLLVLIF